MEAQRRGRSHSLRTATEASRNCFQELIRAKRTWEEVSVKCIPGGEKPGKWYPDSKSRYSLQICRMKHGKQTKLGKKSLMSQVCVREEIKLLPVPLGWEGLIRRLPLPPAWICHCPILRKSFRTHLPMLNSIQLVFVSDLDTASYNAIQNQTSSAKCHPS